MTYEDWYEQEASLCEDLGKHDFGEAAWKAGRMSMKAEALEEAMDGDTYDALMRLRP